MQLTLNMFPHISFQIKMQLSKVSMYDAFLELPPSQVRSESKDYNIGNNLKGFVRKKSKSLKQEAKFV